MQKSNQLCLVELCKREVNTGGYPIPFDKPKLADKWLVFIKKLRQDLPKNLESHLLCPAHFDENSFLKKRGKVTKKLNKKAVPSIVMPGLPPMEIDADDCTNEAPSTSTKKSESDGSESEEESDEESDDEDSQDVKTCFFARRKESPLMFMNYSSDEDVCSDFEPVEDDDLPSIIQEVDKKTKELQNKEAELREMEDIISKQSEIIDKLVWELDIIKRTDSEGHVQPEGPETNEENTQPPLPEVKTETDSIEEDMNNIILTTNISQFTPDYSNKFLRIFSLTLLYFSPKAYAYITSILRTLPPKEEVIRWVQSGEAKTILPQGLSFHENKFFPET